MVRPRPRVVACLGCSCRPLSRSHSRFAWRTAGASYTSHPPPPPRPAGTRLAALRRRSPSICSAAAAHHSLSLPPPPSPRRACLAATAAALGSKPCGWAGAPSGSRPPTRSLNAAERTREAAPACHPDRRRRWRFRWKFRHRKGQLSATRRIQSAALATTPRVCNSPHASDIPGCKKRGMQNATLLPPFSERALYRYISRVVIQPM